MSRKAANKLVGEALKQSGHASPSGRLLNRARDEWLKRVVQDVQDRAHLTGRSELRSLHVRSIGIAEINRGRYKLPADYSHGLTVDLLDATHTGLSQSGATSSVTLASSEDITAADAEGRYILMTAGESKGQYRQITDYDTTTKIASVDKNWDAHLTPASGDSYEVIDASYPIDAEAPEELTLHSVRSNSGRPCRRTIYEKELVFDRAVDKTYGIMLWYYSNPSSLPFSDDTWVRLLDEWMNVLTLGVQFRALRESDDDTAVNVQVDYETSMRSLLEREQDAGRELTSFEVAQ